MILVTGSIKSNGMQGETIWYVSGQWKDEFGNPYILFSTNRAKAVEFETKQQADDFNDKFMRIGQIDKPFKIIY